MEYLSHQLVPLVSHSTPETVVVSSFGNNNWFCFYKRKSEKSLIQERQFYQNQKEFLFSILVSLLNICEHINPTVANVYAQSDLY